MDEIYPNLSKLFPENLEKICQDLKWYLDSSNEPKNLFELHPKFNNNFKNLFDNINTQSLKNQDSYPYLIDSKEDLNINEDTEYLEDPKTTREGKNNNKKELLKKVQEHGKYFEDINHMCKEKRSQIEKNVINTLLSHENELSEFAIDLNYCDNTLKMIEESLNKQFESLQMSSESIKKLHDESKDMSCALENRKKMVEKLEKFVKEVIITPSMIKSLCNDPINESYVVHVEEFGRKSENITRLYKDKEYPAVEFSKIQVKKLELVLIRRIFDFLSLEISNLAIPKVNIQMVQSTRFMTFRPLYKYLCNFPNHTKDLKKLYTYTMKRTYSHLFENYLNSLEACFEKERCRETSCMLRIRSLAVVQKQNKTISYYDMNSRDSILKDFNSQPILPTGLQPNSLKKELIVKSYFKLLVDTCTTEMSFISSFFFLNDPKPNENREENNNTSKDKLDKNMFKEIFVEVFEIMSCNLKVYLRTSFDLVALTLILSILRFNRRFLLHREITFFESEMYEFESLLYERLNFLMNEIISLVSKTTKSPNISTILLWNPAPFVVNSSHIIYVISRLNDYTRKLNPHVIQLLQNLVDFLEKSSEKLDANKNSIFIINNLVPLVSVIKTITDKTMFSDENFDFGEVSKKLEENLQNSLTFYSNFLLTEFISDLINIMDEEEPAIEGVTPKKTLTLATMALEYRNLCMDFIKTYNERVSLIKNIISQSFIHPQTLELVNIHVFNMFYEIYSKFYGITNDIFKDTPTEWFSKMPDPSEFKP
ncbi:uncharacterized protein TA17735 [Theileria annulata]|uniref:Vps52 / Sac2 family n=1 Tax=Theileria annulata TaxID=5874 RepID=Q4UB96_THEAN|nr:uncharacterized protein TA17735 [Theileria annulata]CAI75905.1 hypothetical protein TA17735 [Theileria annulata]|eukprot:XP_955381.1 hypothetical protein TA17735 [Theileria annulata]